MWQIAIFKDRLLEPSQNKSDMIGVHRTDLRERERNEMNIVIEETRLCPKERKWVLSALVRGNEKLVLQHCELQSNKTLGIVCYSPMCI